MNWSEQIHDLTIIQETIEIKITTKSINCFVCTVYRPQSKHKNIDEFTNTPYTLLQKDSIKNMRVIINGDLNTNLLENSTHKQTKKFYFPADD